MPPTDARGERDGAVHEAGGDVRAGVALRGAQAVLVLACAAQLLVPHRGLHVGAAIALHLCATAAYCVLAAAVVRGRLRPGAAEAFALAVALALPALALTPQLSDDVNRYVFEGRLVHAGRNPYAVLPSDPAVAHLLDPAHPFAHHDVPAAYPPAIQYALALAVALSPTASGAKLVFGACVLLAFAALWRHLPAIGIARERAVVFGWCPLPWIECAGEGHTDALTALFVVLAAWAGAAARPIAAGACLAVATAGKLLPCVLLPALARRRPRAAVAFAVTLVLLYLPFLGEPRALFAAATEYAMRWRANDGGYALVHWLTELCLSPWRAGDGYVGLFAGAEVQRVAKLPLLALGVALLVRCWRRAESFERTAFVFFAFFVAFAPAMHPWYVVLFLPWLCVFPRLPLLAFTGTVALAYHVLPRWLAEGVWSEQAWVKVVEYLPLWIGLLG